MAIQEALLMVTSLEDFFIEFGERLKALRLDHGLTQVQIAAVLEVSQQQYLSFEKGRRRIPIAMLPRLAHLLDVSTDELLGITAPKRKRGPSSKLERQLEQLRQLPRSKQRFVSEMIDTFLQHSVSQQAVG